MLSHAPYGDPTANSTNSLWRDQVEDYFAERFRYLDEIFSVQRFTIASELVIASTQLSAYFTDSRDILL